jgi:hypothetical protein
MEENQTMTTSDFIYPHSEFHGEDRADYVRFDRELQEFAQRTAMLSSLETSGKISPLEAYRRIEFMFHRLKRSRRQIRPL